MSEIERFYAITAVHPDSEEELLHVKMNTGELVPMIFRSLDDANAYFPFAGLYADNNECEILMVTFERTTETILQ